MRPNLDPDFATFLAAVFEHRPSDVGTLQHALAEDGACSYSNERAMFLEESLQ
jgi:hypothetical protein